MSKFDSGFSIFSVGVIFALFLLIFLVIMNGCTSNKFKNGVVVDKYRTKNGFPALVVEKNESYGTIYVDEKEYIECEIGDIYAQEQ